MGISRIQRISYRLSAKDCYADSRAVVDSYLETLYRLYREMTGNAF